MSSGRRASAAITPEHPQITRPRHVWLVYTCTSEPSHQRRRAYDRVSAVTDRLPSASADRAHPAPLFAMHPTRPLQAGAIALVLGTAAAAPLLAPAPPASDRLPKPSLETFRQTEATTFEDYAGRAVLIEFFEHW